MKKTVVYANGSIGSPLEMLAWERADQFRSTCRAIKNIKEAYLTIKLHPYERELDTYKKIVKEMGLLNYTIVKNVEMLELLGDCDLLITSASTAGYEAVLLGKNVISLRGRFLSEDKWDFKNAAISVDNLEDLEIYVRGALFHPEVRAKLKKGREEYISEHALEGNASDRVKEVIDSFVKR